MIVILLSNLQFEKKVIEIWNIFYSLFVFHYLLEVVIYTLWIRGILFAVNIHPSASKCWTSNIQKKDLSNQTGIWKQIRHHHCSSSFILSLNWITNHTYKNYTLFICVFLLTMGVQISCLAIRWSKQPAGWHFKSLVTSSKGEGRKRNRYIEVVSNLTSATLIVSALYHRKIGYISMVVRKEVQDKQMKQEYPINNV